MSDKPDLGALFPAPPEKTKMGAPLEADGVRAWNKPSRYEFVRQVLESPGEDNYLARLPPEQQERIALTHRRLKSGVSVSGPLWCFGPKKCPFHALCPLAEINEQGEILEAPLEHYPLGRPCILEDAFMRQKIVDYLEALQVDHQDPVEMAQVKELALIDLQKQRALNILAVGDKDGQGRDFMRHDTTVVGIGPNGQALENNTTTLHPLQTVLDQLESRRQKWLTKLLATRKDRVDAQAKLGQKEEQLELNSVILELREHLRGVRTKRVDAQSERLLPLDD